MNKKGICLHDQLCYGFVTVSDKGQVAIPVDARNALDIKTGDKLLVLRRRDGKGVSLVKAEVMEEFLRNIQE
jgi:AbrB family looped-hinge helix DNA binding protein